VKTKRVKVVLKFPMRNFLPFFIPLEEGVVIIRGVEELDRVVADF
jgi:hypothetical protein